VQECSLLHQIKNELAEACCEAFNCATKLLEVSGILAIDVDTKNSAIRVEKQTLYLQYENPSYVCRKPDTNRSIKYAVYT
jgi:hypothetical protein